MIPKKAFELIQKAIDSLRKRGVFGVLTAGFIDLLQHAERYIIRLRDYQSRYHFENRSTGKLTLVVVLAGYKPYLWPATLTRIRDHAPSDADLCIVSAGLFSNQLSDFCEKNSWSYISVKRNSPGVALNTAISLHPSADFIYKLDEDIVIGRKYFQLLREGYEYAQQDHRQEPGFCAPVLNVNGVSYRIFLRELGLELDFQSKFGPLLTRCDDLPVHNDPAAAWWIWLHTLPFDENAERFAKRIGRYETCYTRFSIGAILFRRKFIYKVGGFKSSWHSGILGIDEDMLCRDCVSHSRPMVIIESALAGHFSFYPQEALMREKLPQMSSLDPKAFPPRDYSIAGSD